MSMSFDEQSRAIAMRAKGASLRDISKELGRGRNTVARVCSSSQRLADLKVEALSHNIMFRVSDSQMGWVKKTSASMGVSQAQLMRLMIDIIRKDKLEKAIFEN